MNVEKLINEFANAVDEMNETHFGGTYYWRIDTDDDGNNWAIVLSYQDYDGDGEKLYSKLAYQPSNSIMQCDYDIDWLMPYDKDTGEVYDTELSVYSSADAKEAVTWLLDCYYEYAIDRVNDYYDKLGKAIDEKDDAAADKYSDLYENAIERYAKQFGYTYNQFEDNCTDVRMFGHGIS